MSMGIWRGNVANNVSLSPVASALAIVGLPTSFPRSEKDDGVKKSADKVPAVAIKSIKTMKGTCEP